MTIPNRFRLTFADDGVVEVSSYVKGTKGPAARHFVQEGDADARLAGVLVWIREQRGVVAPVPLPPVDTLSVGTTDDDLTFETSTEG